MSTNTIAALSWTGEDGKSLAEHFQAASEAAVPGKVTDLKERVRVLEDACIAVLDACFAQADRMNNEREEAAAAVRRLFAEPTN